MGDRRACEGSVESCMRGAMHKYFRDSSVGGGRFPSTNGNNYVDCCFFDIKIEYRFDICRGKCEITIIDDSGEREPIDVDIPYSKGKLDCNVLFEKSCVPLRELTNCE